MFLSFSGSPELGNVKFVFGPLSQIQGPLTANISCSILGLAKFLNQEYVCMCVCELFVFVSTDVMVFRQRPARSVHHSPVLESTRGPRRRKELCGRSFTRSAVPVCFFFFFFFLLLLPSLLPFLTFPLLLFSSPLSSSLFPFSPPHSIHASPCLPDTCSNNSPFLRHFRASLFNLSVHPFTRPLYIPVASHPQPLMKID